MIEFLLLQQFSFHFFNQIIKVADHGIWELKLLIVIFKFHLLSIFGKISAEAYSFIHNIVNEYLFLCQPFA